MRGFRALFLAHRQAALLLVVVALFFKAVVPAGFMVASSAQTFITVSVCSESTGGTKLMTIAVPKKTDGASGHAEDKAKDGHCAFSGFAKAATGGADPFLLSLAIAFLLLLGLAPVRQLALRRAYYLFPPLRGPPATA